MKLIVDRLVTVDECPWLDEDVQPGTTVFTFSGQTYGCIGPNGIAVSYSPYEYPFFEIPRNAIKEIM